MHKDARVGFIDGAFLSAKSFQAIAKIFTSSIDASTPEGLEKLVLDRGGLSSSATNLGLALELYIKTLLMITEGIAIRDHKLIDLFKKLPAPIRTEAEKLFDAEMKLRGAEATNELTLEVYAGAEPVHGAPAAEPLFQEPDQVAMDLRSLLRRNRDAFVTWRYVHEAGKPNAWLPIRYEWAALGSACDVFRKLIEDRFQHQYRMGSKREVIG